MHVRDAAQPLVNRFIALPVVLLIGPVALAAHALAVPSEAWRQAGRSKERWVAVLSVPVALGAAVLPASSVGWLGILIADAAAATYLARVRPVVSVAAGADRVARGLPVEPWREWVWPAVVGVILFAALVAVVLWP
jgi:hypothetical protein